MELVSEEETASSRLEVRGGTCWGGGGRECTCPQHGPVPSRSC